MEAQGDLLEHLPGAEQVAEAQRGAVAEAVAQLGVPRVDEELHLHVVQQVQLEPLVPIKVETSTSYNCPGLVDMVDLYDAVEVTEPLVPAGSLEASSREEVDVQGAGEPEVPGVAVPVNLVLDKVSRVEVYEVGDGVLLGGEGGRAGGAGALGVEAAHGQPVPLPRQGVAPLPRLGRGEEGRGGGFTCSPSLRESRPERVLFLSLRSSWRGMALVVCSESE